MMLLLPLNAQTASAPPAAQPAAAVSGQAPDEATNKITELVHAGKYGEAQQLVNGLLIAYPSDARLVQAKGLIEQLMAAPAPAAAAPAATVPAAAALTGEDKLDYSALIEMVRQAQESTDLEEQTRLLQQFMEQSAGFLKQHPEQMEIWQLRGAAAISLQEPKAGYEAGQRLLAAGAMDNGDANVQQLLAKLKLLGWMDKEKVEGLQLQADAARSAQVAASAAEQAAALRAQYTFPAAHADGFHYGYGHITINADDAVYVGTDSTIHMQRSEIGEVRVACFSYVCGMYFTPKGGRKYFIVAMTEEAVNARVMQQNSVRPPAVLGNAVVARWGFVQGNDKNKVLVPPEGKGRGRGK